VKKAVMYILIIGAALLIFLALFAALKISAAVIIRFIIFIACALSGGRETV